MPPTHFRPQYVFQTSGGPFYIAQAQDGRFHPLYNLVSLGRYDRPDQAGDDLAGGHTFPTRPRMGTATLGIRQDLVELTALS